MCLILGKTRTFPQGDGPMVQLRVFGDEFYARYETLDGYTVVYDTRLEKYCFAVLIKGSLTSSGSPMDKPIPPGIVRHLQEDKEIRNKKFDYKYAIMRPPSSPIPGVEATLGENNGLLPGKQLSREKKVLGLTILINFKDEKTQIPSEKVNELLNGDGFKAYGNACSVKEYYRTMSTGRLEYVNEVVGPVTLSKNRNHYIENPCMNEALSLAVSKYNLDLSRFDCTGRGVVDAINFLYAGETLYEGWLWPHNHTMSFSFNGIRTNFYTIQSLGRQPVDMKIGTFCHEAGHLICRFPDLYDYGKRDGDSDPSAGLGYFCLMASGSHLDKGRNPAPLSAYLRNLAGWTDHLHLLNDAGEFSIDQGDYNSLYTFRIENKPNEYFIVENRTRMGMDAFCPSSGLAVYHCDILGSNEWQGGTATNHYQCALVQADGALHLETNRNSGDEEDLFKDKKGVVLSNETIPSSRAWGGSESGFMLYDVGKPGKTMSFRVGNPLEPDSGGTAVLRESRPSVLIPDNSKKGVSDVISVKVKGIIETITVSVDITHTYAGDLKIELVPPGGKPMVLRQKKGGDKNDVKESYDSGSVLSSLKGKNVEGNWTIKVMDLGKKDVGRFNAWKLEINC
jgi:M6 family metalloprotease-like protein